MKKILVLLFVLMITFDLYAQNTTEAGVSGSPYLMIIKEIPTKTDVQLTKTDVDVNVSGVIADVTVRQYYKSVSDQVLEAVYVFPASVHAAVYSMKMKIGSREIIAVIKEKEQARKDYEQAKSEGKRASLLVQDRPNLFTMNLANIAPGDLIEIEMKYTEMLVPDDKIYTFSFPNIIIPRYGNGETSDTTKTANLEETRFVSNSAFDIRFNLISPVPIDGIECITHEVNYGGETANHSLITLKDSEKNSAPKDFVVKYKLAGDLINSGLLLSKGEGKDAENFFLLTVQPPKRIDPAYIPPREYIFVLDVSGSMEGFPSDMAKKTISNLIDKLDKNDKFNVILFASGFDVFSDNLVTANRDNLDKAFRFMAESRQGGGTEMLPALEKALTMPKDSKASRSVIIITDGCIDFEGRAFELIRENLNKANVFAFGIGTGMNKFTIEGIARAGDGIAFEINRIEDAEYQSERFIKYISTPILANIKVTYDGFGVSEVEPASVPDLFPERPIVIYGKWDGNLQGGIKIEAINGQEKIFVDLPVAKFGEMVQGDALKQLWARKQIELLSDYQSFGQRDKFKKQVTDLGLKYNLMTAYTSFIAVDREVVENKDGSQGYEIRKSRAEDTQIQVDRMDISNQYTGGLGSAGSGYATVVSQYAGQESLGARLSSIGSIGCESMDYYSAEPSGGGLFDVRSSRSLDVVRGTDALLGGRNKVLDNSIIGGGNYGGSSSYGNHISQKTSYNVVPDIYIVYDSLELARNIISIQKSKNDYEEGFVNVSVDISKKGQVKKINILSYCSENLTEMVKKAIQATIFKPAQKNGKNINYAVDIKLNIVAPVLPISIEFNGKTYIMNMSKANNTKYWFAKTADGQGEKIEYLDKVILDYSVFDENQKLIKKDILKITPGIGRQETIIDEALVDMQICEEKLILYKNINNYYNALGLYPQLTDLPTNQKIFVKIKVLEINPK